MSGCFHEAWEMDTAAHADGVCPLCQSETIADLRGALAMIWHNVEPNAIRHLDYDHLAADIAAVCETALAGEYRDNMRAAEVYDTLKAQEAQP